MQDLNRAHHLVKFDEMEGGTALIREDNGVTVGATQVVFINIKQFLISKINKWPHFVAAMAWLTDFDILDAMKGKGLGIAIQKEDFLRPDMDMPNDWQILLRNAASPFGCMQRSEYGINCPAYRLGYNGGSHGECRCVGLADKEQQSRPNMHHKFIVFGDFEGTDDDRIFKPRAVWTGSYNFSVNATKSLENGVYIEDERIAQAYYHESWAKTSTGRASTASRNIALTDRECWAVTTIIPPL